MNPTAGVATTCNTEHNIIYTTEQTKNYES